MVDNWCWYGILFALYLLQELMDFDQTQHWMGLGGELISFL